MCFEIRVGTSLSGRTLPVTSCIRSGDSCTSLLGKLPSSSTRRSKPRPSLCTGETRRASSKLQPKQNIFAGTIAMNRCHQQKSSSIGGLRQVAGATPWQQCTISDAVDASSRLQSSTAPLELDA